MKPFVLFQNCRLARNKDIRVVGIGFLLKVVLVGTDSMFTPSVQ